MASWAVLAAQLVSGRCVTDMALYSSSLSSSTSRYMTVPPVLTPLGASGIVWLAGCPTSTAVAAASPLPASGLSASAAASAAAPAASASTFAPSLASAASTPAVSASGRGAFVVSAFGAEAIAEAALGASRRDRSRLEASTSELSTQFEGTFIVMSCTAISRSRLTPHPARANAAVRLSAQSAIRDAFFFIIHRSFLAGSEALRCGRPPPSGNARRPLRVRFIRGRRRGSCRI